MTDRFSESQMLRLVEVYRDYECLWNMWSDLYKNREARQIAYMEIYRRLNIPGLELKDIPKKIKNLRSSYCQELKRMENSIRQGNTGESLYEPRVSWFSLAESYLKPFIKRHELIAPDPSVIPAGEMTSYGHSQTNVNYGSKEELLAESLRRKEIKREDESEEESFNEENTKNIKRCSYENTQTFKNNGISSGFSLSKNEHNISQVLAKIEKIANNITKCAETFSKTKEDEFDIFGRYIAKTLRSLPKELSIAAKLAIQKSVSDIQIKAVRKEKIRSESYGFSTTTETDELK
ncbi:unnamed protein product [Danaus chrysippus]|uniref:(African queen) hypothetical protein n=1 Tax=Danaus chrysippus TaxID=151541 RepID=A0A8J2R8R8_9NEOP|nr:unnamed protein product [Danaus chrysippus]